MRERERERERESENEREGERDRKESSTVLEKYACTINNDWREAQPCASAGTAKKERSFEK